MSNTIKLAIAGVGNCCSSLIQGLAFYDRQPTRGGLMEPKIGDWSPSDIEPVAAFDVDSRKVGKPLSEATFAEPNCARVFQRELPKSKIIVQMGPVLDGVAPHLDKYPVTDRCLVADKPSVDVVKVLKETGAQVMVCYLPVGSEEAVKHYAQACLEAGVAFVNCVPVFIASDETWAKRFKDAGIPIIGDDIKSQLGATILHRAVARLFNQRGIGIRRTYQLNTGGNTDFLNMLDHNRLSSKKVSKTQSVQSQLDEPLTSGDIHIGPSDYVSWQDDNKVAFIRLEGQGFGDQPIELEMRLSVQDSPNSAGVVIDAIRCARLAAVRGMGGPILPPSACYMKSPPQQFADSVAYDKNIEFMECPVKTEC